MLSGMAHCLSARHVPLWRHVIPWPPLPAVHPVHPPTLVCCTRGLTQGRQAGAGHTVCLGHARAGGGHGLRLRLGSQRLGIDQGANGSPGSSAVGAGTRGAQRALKFRRCLDVLEACTSWGWKGRRAEVAAAGLGATAGTDSHGGRAVCRSCWPDVSHMRGQCLKQRTRPDGAVRLHSAGAGGGSGGKDGSARSAGGDIGVLHMGAGDGRRPGEADWPACVS